MKKTKDEWITAFRKEADRILPIALRQTDKKKAANIVNNTIKEYRKNIR